MRFTKIRYNKKVELAWELDGESHSLACEQEPTPEFQQGVAAFEQLLRDTCGLPRGGELQVHTISISHNEETGSRNLVVSATRTVPAGSYSISTPSLHEKTDLGKASTQKNIPDHALTLLDKLDELAKAYVKGERAQVSANLNGNGDGEHGKSEKHGDELELDGMPTPAPAKKARRVSKQARRTGRRD